MNKSNYAEIDVPAVFSFKEENIIFARHDLPLFAVFQAFKKTPKPPETTMINFPAKIWLSAKPTPNLRSDLP